MACPPPSSQQGLPAPNAARRAPSRHAFWLKQLHQWHWISSAVCLLGMMLFAITGLTLNNAARIESKPHVVTREAQLPAPLIANANQAAASQAASLPLALADWLRHEWRIDADDRKVEWSPGEVYLSLPRPGGDAWVDIDLKTGLARYEVTDRGWIAYLNDLHKGRNTGSAWRWFIDVFSVACLVFSLTGLLLLKMHAAKRAATWPIVGLGVLIPLLLALVFIH